MNEGEIIYYLKELAGRYDNLEYKANATRKEGYYTF